MVQQVTLSPPVQLSSETVQVIVGLLTQHNAWNSHTTAVDLDQIWALCISNVTQHHFKLIT